MYLGRHYRISLRIETVFILGSDLLSSSPWWDHLHACDGCTLVLSHAPGGLCAGDTPSIIFHSVTIEHNRGWWIFMRGAEGQGPEEKGMSCRNISWEWSWSLYCARQRLWITERRIFPMWFQFEVGKTVMATFDLHRWVSLNQCLVP